VFESRLAVKVVAVEIIELLPNVTWACLDIEIGHIVELLDLKVGH
jgi:hypothetical protein